MKRTLLTRLPDSDVFYVPPSLGLKTPPQSFTTLDGLVAKGLHPLSYRYALNTIGGIPEFTVWAQRVLKLNGELPRKRYWRESKID
jgi:hypothetical protein